MGAKIVPLFFFCFFTLPERISLSRMGCVAVLVRLALNHNNYAVGVRSDGSVRKVQVNSLYLHFGSNAVVVDYLVAAIVQCYCNLLRLIRKAP